MRMNRLFACLVASFAFALVAVAHAGAALAAPRVDLELVTEERAPVTAPQSWIESLKDAGTDSLRVRSARSGDKAEVVTRGSGESATYTVTGIITDRNQLILPGGKRFTLSDKAAIKDWIADLKLGGADDIGAERGAFGLTSKELVEAHEALSVKVSFSTRGQPSNEVVDKIARGVSLPLELSASARTALAGRDAVLDEVSGLSSGTALAAVLRPLGLVLVPDKPRGGKLRLVITDGRSVKESWPVGWPSRKPPGETMPDLFKFLNVEIKDIELSTAVSAIRERVGAPFLYDHNSMAREGIEPSGVKVSLPSGRTFYEKALSRLLFQADLKSEIRVDEADQPLLWITTLKE